MTDPRRYPRGAPGSVQPGAYPTGLGSAPPTRPRSLRPWLVLLVATVVLAISFVVVVNLVGADEDRDADPIAAGHPPRSSDPIPATATVEAAEKALQKAGYRCYDALAEPPVRRCLHADGPSATMVGVGFERAGDGTIARLQIESYSDEFAHLAGGGDYDKADQARHTARTQLTNEAYQAVMPDLYGQDTAGWADKIGSKNQAKGHGVIATFLDNGHTTEVLILPAHAGQPPMPDYRKLKLAPAEFKQKMRAAGFVCSSRYKDCTMPSKATKPGRVSVTDGVQSDVAFNARVGYELTRETAADDIAPAKVAKAFTSILRLADYNAPQLAQLVSKTVAAGSAATIDVDNANIFVNAKLAKGKVSYAALRVQGVYW